MGSCALGHLLACRELAQGRTSVFVVHRLSTIRNCEKIVVMEAGRVVEQGTHEARAALTPDQADNDVLRNILLKRIPLHCRRCKRDLLYSIGF